jgi:hypothetical protein
MPRPRRGDWLEDELHSLRNAGVDIVLSLLTDHEIAACPILRQAGIEVEAKSACRDTIPRNPQRVHQDYRHLAPSPRLTWAFASCAA